MKVYAIVSLKNGTFISTDKNKHLQLRKYLKQTNNYHYETTITNDIINVTATGSNVKINIDGRKLK